MGLMPFQFAVEDPVEEAPVKRDPFRSPAKVRALLASEEEPTAEQEKTAAVQEADESEIQRTSVRRWDPEVVQYLFDTYGHKPVPGDPYGHKPVPRGRPFQLTTGIGGTKPQPAPGIVEQATDDSFLTRISPFRAKTSKKDAFASEDVFASNADFDDFMEQAETMGPALKEGFEQARTEFSTRVQRPPIELKGIKGMKIYAPEGPDLEFGSELGGVDPSVDPKEFEHVASPAIESIKNKGVRVKDETVNVEGLRDEMAQAVDIIADAFIAVGLNPPVMTDAKTQRNKRTFHDIGLGVDFRWKDLDDSEQEAVMAELDKWAPRGKTRKGSPVWAKDGYQIIIHKEIGNEVHIHAEYDTPETKAELDKYVASPAWGLL